MTSIVRDGETSGAPGGWDRRLFLEINDFARHTPWLHRPLHLYGTFGVLIFAGLLVAGWWLARRRGDQAKLAAAVWAPVGTLLALALTPPILDMIGEGRPAASMPHILVLAHQGQDLYFPSDHAIMAGAIAAGLSLVDRRLGLLATAAALLMAFTGVYVAAYYPHDVLAGLLFGAVFVLIGYALLDDLIIRLLKRLADSPLRPLITTETRKSPRIQATSV